MTPNNINSTTEIEKGDSNEPNELSRMKAYSKLKLDINGLESNLCVWKSCIEAYKKDITSLMTSNNLQEPKLKNRQLEISKKQENLRVEKNQVLYFKEKLETNLLKVMKQVENMKNKKRKMEAVLLEIVRDEEDLKNEKETLEISFSEIHKNKIEIKSKENQSERILKNIQDYKRKVRNKNNHVQRMEAEAEARINEKARLEESVRFVEKAKVEEKARLEEKVKLEKAGKMDQEAKFENKRIEMQIMDTDVESEEEDIVMQIVETESNSEEEIIEIYTVKKGPVLNQGIHMMQLTEEEACWGRSLLEKKPVGEEGPKTFTKKKRVKTKKKIF